MTKQGSTRTLISLCVIASAALPGCDWAVFDEIEDSAPVRVFEAPEGYRGGGYGSVLTTARATLSSGEVSRVFASAGGDSAVVNERAWDGEGVRSDSSVRCKDREDCEAGVGVGATLISVPLWGKDADVTHRGCVFAPANPTGYMLCETNASQNQKVALEQPSDNDKNTAGYGGASIPANFAGLGVALVGQYWLEEQTRRPLTGGLYYLPDLEMVTNTPTLAELDAENPLTGAPFAEDGAPNNFGYQVAAAENGAGELVVAVSQPSKSQVVVFTIDQGATKADVQDKFRTRACIRSPNPELIGFGKVLALGDVTGDGEPELFTGIDPRQGENGGLQRLYMYDGRSMPDRAAVSPGQCPLWDSEPTQVGCFDGIRGVMCQDSGFGSSIAVGDVDGDGFGDLIAGAPKADVQGEEDAGVVWVIPGDADGLDFDRMTNLYASNQESGAALGTAVGALHTRDRDEPVAGAPGMKSLFVFTCSPLETDAPGSSQCLPQ